MIEQNKGGSQANAFAPTPVGQIVSPQPASSLAGMFQGAGSYMPPQYTLPTISQPGLASGSGKGATSMQGGMGGMGGVLSPQEAAAATAARMQERTPPVVAAPAGPAAITTEQWLKQIEDEQKNRLRLGWGDGQGGGT